MNAFRIFHCSKTTFYVIVVMLFSSNAKSQLLRTWTYSYNPVGNYESSGNSIVSLPSGNAVTAGVYTATTGARKNTLLLTDVSGMLLQEDTSVIGFGYRKVIYDGNAHIYAAATLTNDSLPVSKIVVAKFDTDFGVRRFFVPDSSTTFPIYDVQDFALLVNERFVVASHWDAFPFVCLSLTCMDSSGSVLWERIDSSFQFSYDVKLLPDMSGGFFASGSGRDTSTADDFIFVSHYTSGGNRDWLFRYYSPAHNFADLTDMIRDVTGQLYVSGIVMDSLGQRGFLMKFDSAGALAWNKTILPLPYLRIISDNTGNVYGASVPQNGIDVVVLEKLDSAGLRLDSTAFQLSGYFTSELGDIKLAGNNAIVASGGLYVLSFPKSDLFIVTFDTSLILMGYDVYDSLNLLGEAGRALSYESNGCIYACGRINYENQFETSNIGILKYDLSGLINSNNSAHVQEMEIFPNPSTGKFRIRLDNISDGKTCIRIYSTMGIEVMRDELPSRCREKDYDLAFSSGLYYIILETGKCKSTRIISIAD